MNKKALCDETNGKRVVIIQRESFIASSWNIVAPMNSKRYKINSLM
jgi:hypothetical protein